MVRGDISPFCVHPSSSAIASHLFRPASLSLYPWLAETVLFQPRVVPGPLASRPGSGGIGDGEHSALSGMSLTSRVVLPPLSVRTAVAISRRRLPPCWLPCRLFGELRAVSRFAEAWKCGSGGSPPAGCRHFSFSFSPLLGFLLICRLSSRRVWLSWDLNWLYFAVLYIIFDIIFYLGAAFLYACSGML